MRDWTDCAFTICSLIVPEKAMAPHSSTLAWKILWTEEPGRLQSMGSLSVGHGRAGSTAVILHFPASIVCNNFIKVKEISHTDLSNRIQKQFTDII